MADSKLLRRSSPISRIVALLLFVALVCLSMPERGESTYLVFTIDVCWTCGNDFQGTWKGKDYGVPLIAEMLQQHGLKGTFFVSPLCPPDLTDKMLSNLSYLFSQGHDLQLHPHPDSVDFSRLSMPMYTVQERRKIFQTAIDNIKRVGAPSPIAHRAGRYAIDSETLSLLPEFGIAMDSSIFPVEAGSQVPLPDDLVNRFVKIGDVYQLPITMIRRVPFIGYAGMNALDLDRTTWEEQERALKQIADHRLPVATFFLHYFSLYHFIPSLISYQPHTVTGPNKENIQKLDNVLKLVTADKRFKVVTARELWELFQERPQDFQGASYVPYTGMWLTYLKAWKYFFGHSILNKIVAIAPIVLVAAVLTVLGYFRRPKAAN